MIAAGLSAIPTASGSDPRMGLAFYPSGAAMVMRLGPL